MESGIYKIVNIANDRVYVGSSINVGSRMGRHKSALRSGKHHSIHLQRAWDKYGEGGFAFEVVEIVTDKGTLIEREQHWIDALGAYGNGYNGRPIANSCLGFRHSAKSRAKMSEILKGQPSRRLGFVATDETRAKMSKSRKGVPQSAEHIRIRAEANTGKKRSAGARANISNALKGKKRGPTSAATKLKQRTSMKAVYQKKPAAEKAELAKLMSLRISAYWAGLTPDERVAKSAALSIGRTGRKRRPHSDATKEKLRQSSRLAWGDGRNHAARGLRQAPSPAEEVSS